MPILDKINHYVKVISKYFHSVSQYWTCKSSRPDVFHKIGVLKNFTKFTGKDLWQNLFFNKVADDACNFIKTRLWHRCFPVNFVEFLRTSFFYRTPPVAASELAGCSLSKLNQVANAFCVFDSC